MVYFHWPLKELTLMNKTAFQSCCIFIKIKLDILCFIYVNLNDVVRYIKKDLYGICYLTMCFSKICTILLNRLVIVKAVMRVVITAYSLVFCDYFYTITPNIFSEIATFLETL